MSDDQSPRRRDVKEMVGEFLRETAALVFVFSFLDKLVSRDLTITWSVLTVILAVGLLILGISMERRRQ